MLSSHNPHRHIPKTWSKPACTPYQHDLPRCLTTYLLKISTSFSYRTHFTWFVVTHHSFHFVCEWQKRICNFFNFFLCLGKNKRTFLGSFKSNKTITSTYLNPFCYIQTSLKIARNHYSKLWTIEGCVFNVILYSTLEKYDSYFVLSWFSTHKKSTSSSSSSSSSSSNPCLALLNLCCIFIAKKKKSTE